MHLRVNDETNLVPKHSGLVTTRNGNRTEWSPIRSVIIRVINKIGRPRSGSPICLITSMISNGNRTEWSPIRSVIIRVINKIGRPRSGSPICLITSMITDRIGRHEVLLPINHNLNKICNI